jgi:hypothetical protein
MRHALAVILLFVVGSAQAIPVTWTLDGVTFDDGGIASGSFVYDADVCCTIFDVNIHTTAGTSMTGADYLTNSSLAGNATGLNPTGTTGTLLLLFAEGLTNAGGSIALLPGPCFASCEFRSEPISATRGVLTGSITAVPIPAAVWLFGSGLGLLGWLRRRQSA